MRQRGLFVMMLFLLLAAPSAWAGIYYEQEMKMPPPTGVVKVVCYISGPKLRVESTVQGTETITIQRFDTGMTYSLMPAQKMCMEMRIPEPSPQKEAQTKVTVTKTDQTKKVGKYNCTRYDVTVNDQTVTYWMTQDVDLGKELDDLWQGVARGQSAKLAQEMAKLKGFPMMTEMVTPQGTMTMTVTTVEKKDIPDSMFEVPADYEKMSMPGAAGGLDEAARRSAGTLAAAIFL